MFHVKDAELNPTGRQGVYGGYQSWVDRAGRFRSLGDGQVDFKARVFQAHPVRFRRLGRGRMGMRDQAPEDGAREGAQFVKDHIIRVTETAFDDFADGGTDDGRQPQDAGIGLAAHGHMKAGACDATSASRGSGWAWSVAGAMLSSAGCIGSPAASTTVRPGRRGVQPNG
jgi:hypothetical protein